MGQIQSHELVTRIQYGQKDGGISLCTRVGLYVGPFCTEDLFQAVDGDAFALVYHFTTSVVTFAGIAFGILVGEARAHGLHHLVAYEVFRGNQFDAFQLALVFFFDDVENQFISFHIVVLVIGVSTFDGTKIGISPVLAKGFAETFLCSASTGLFCCLTVQQQLLGKAKLSQYSNENYTGTLTTITSVRRTEYRSTHDGVPAYSGRGTVTQDISCVVS